MTDAPIDIVGFGAVAVDDLIFVDHYPPADAKTAVRHRERQCGGLAATALVAAARLGAHCAYCGTLGRDELSQFAERCLRCEGIDLSRLVRHDNAQPIHSVIVIDQASNTRNIFFDNHRFGGPDPASIDPVWLRRAQVLLIDHLCLDGMVWAARVGRDAQIPLVADFEGDQDDLRFAELMDLVDHLIVSRDFAVNLTGTADPSAAVQALWSSQREVVVVTCGAEGGWYMDDAQEPRHCPAFPVHVLDTTGCGDVFHGAYAVALSKGLDLSERIRYASAAAALTATGLGGQTTAPTHEMVSRLLQEKFVP
ncbi:MAG: carbohydrate kinase family protein [Chloroflexota bacterium]